jgi:hypothetical protein
MLLTFYKNSAVVNILQEFYIVVNILQEDCNVVNIVQEVCSMQEVCIVV